MCPDQQDMNQELDPEGEEWERQETREMESKSVFWLNCKFYFFFRSIIQQKGRRGGWDAEMSGLEASLADRKR